MCPLRATITASKNKFSKLVLKMQPNNGPYGSLDITDIQVIAEFE
jgi:hypothetical protein